ncbi:hypothetical protein J1614_009896 [Plenodomus biglobosus]|nr:hypothetical protein J1614_009896 [Plenodomus biglobosus]
MGALLASSSLHLASEAKDAATARRLVHASLDHQNRAIVGLRQNLQSLSPENCDNVFLTAVLMMMCAFVSSIMPVAQAKSSTGMMVDAFHFLKGAQAVGIRCFPWLFKGRALELFGTGEKKATKKSGLDAAVAIERLQSLNNETSCGESRDLLNSLIVKLEKGFSGDVDEVPWLMSAGSDYIHLLCKEDLAAKALLMHYGVLLARTEGIWWARMAGEKIVEEMVQVLEGSWNGSADVIAWCREHARQ